jgi:hypothetical protein
MAGSVQEHQRNHDIDLVGAFLAVGLDFSTVLAALSALVGGGALRLRATVGLPRLIEGHLVLCVVAQRYLAGSTPSACLADALTAAFFDAGRSNVT